MKTLTPDMVAVGTSRPRCKRINWMGMRSASIYPPLVGACAPGHHGNRAQLSSLDPRPRGPCRARFQLRRGGPLFHRSHLSRDLGRKPRFTSGSQHSRHAAVAYWHRIREHYRVPTNAMRASLLANATARSLCNRLDAAIKASGQKLFSPSPRTAENRTGA